MIAFLLLAATFAAGWYDAFWWLPLPTILSLGLAFLERWTLNRRFRRDWDADGLSANARGVWLKEAVGSVGCVAILSVAVFYLAAFARGWLA